MACQTCRKHSLNAGAASTAAHSRAGIRPLRLYHIFAGVDARKAASLGPPSLPNEGDQAGTSRDSARRHPQRGVQEVSDGDVIPKFGSTDFQSTSSLPFHDGLTNSRSLREAMPSWKRRRIEPVKPEKPVAPRLGEVQSARAFLKSCEEEGRLIPTLAPDEVEELLGFAGSEDKKMSIQQLSTLYGLPRWRTLLLVRDHQNLDESGRQAASKRRRESWDRLTPVERAALRTKKMKVASSLRLLQLLQERSRRGEELVPDEEVEPNDDASGV